MHDFLTRLPDFINKLFDVVKGGEKVSHPGGGKGDHLIRTEAVSL
jgi:hypothetical protein